MPRNFKATVQEVREALRALGLHPACPVVEGDLDGCVGEFDPNHPPMITVARGQAGQRLWRTVLHEYGHFFGLEHTRSGVMHYRSKTKSDFSCEEPTPAQKKRWTMEIARLVLAKRGKQWRV